MYRLAELTQSQRKRLGWALMIGGSLILVVAVWWIHYSSFARTTLVDGVTVPVVVEYFNWVPRGWFWKALGYLAAFAASQMLLVGAALAFVVGRTLTWSLAAFLAFLAWIELVLIFGIVPSEWLNLSQTDLDWSPQRIFISIPAVLVLGNQVDISLAALKDIISGGYHAVMLGAAAVFAYKIQEFGKPRKAPEKVAQISPYGRPLIRSGD